MLGNSETILDNEWFKSNITTVYNPILVIFRLENRPAVWNMSIQPFWGKGFWLESCHLELDYQIANYFGDTSGVHRRIYVLIGNKLHQQENSAGVEFKKLTKGIKGILKEIQTFHW